MKNKLGQKEVKAALLGIAPIRDSNDDVVSRDYEVVCFDLVDGFNRFSTGGIYVNKVAYFYGNKQPVSTLIISGTQINCEKVVIENKKCLGALNILEALSDSVKNVSILTKNIVLKIDMSDSEVIDTLYNQALKGVYNNTLLEEIHIDNISSMESDRYEITKNTIDKMINSRNSIEIILYFIYLVWLLTKNNIYKELLVDTYIRIMKLKNVTNINELTKLILTKRLFIWNQIKEKIYSNMKVYLP